MKQIYYLYKNGPFNIIDLEFQFIRIISKFDLHLEEFKSDQMQIPVQPNDKLDVFSIRQLWGIYN